MVVAVDLQKSDTLDDGERDEAIGDYLNIFDVVVQHYPHKLVLSMFGDDADVVVVVGDPRTLFSNSPISNRGKVR